jgi:flagellar basal-body rod modification protein FlgD
MEIDSSNPFASLGLGLDQKVKATEKDQGELALEDFMSLMTTQMKNQDPLKPMESGEFLGQIAAFGTVSGINDLQTSFDGFASSMQSDQALQGSALIGRSALVQSSMGTLTAESGLKGVVNVDEGVTDLTLRILNDTGSLVRTIDMGAAAGETRFTWDGTNENGEAMSPGVYQVMATGTVDDQTTSFATSMAGKIESVLVGNEQGLIMNLEGIGAVPFSQAQEII